MPAHSIVQQRYFGMLLNKYRSGDTTGLSEEDIKTMNALKGKGLKDFAETSHKGLPQKTNNAIDKQALWGQIASYGMKALPKVTRFAAKNPTLSRAALSAGPGAMIGGTGKAVFGSKQDGNMLQRFGQGAVAGGLAGAGAGAGWGVARGLGAPSLMKGTGKLFGAKTPTFGRYMAGLNMGARDAVKMAGNPGAASAAKGMGKAPIKTTFEEVIPHNVPNNPMPKGLPAPEEQKLLPLPKWDDLPTYMKDPQYKTSSYIPKQAGLYNIGAKALLGAGIGAGVGGVGDAVISSKEQGSFWDRFGRGALYGAGAGAIGGAGYGMAMKTPSIIMDAAKAMPTKANKISPSLEAYRRTHYVSGQSGKALGVKSIPKTDYTLKSSDALYQKLTFPKTPGNLKYRAPVGKITPRVTTAATAAIPPKATANNNRIWASMKKHPIRWGLGGITGVAATGMAASSITGPVAGDSYVQQEQYVGQ